MCQPSDFGIPMCALSHVAGGQKGVAQGDKKRSQGKEKGNRAKNLTTPDRGEEEPVAEHVDDRSAPPLEIQLFGPLTVRVNGKPLPRLRSRKGQWLLALLALRHGRELDRDWLAFKLWMDSTEKRASENLHKSLQDLRKALGTEATRLYTPQPRTLGLNLSGAKVDVAAFDEAIARGDLASLEEAVHLYRDPLLEGCTEEWVYQEREARQQQYLEARETLAKQAAQRRDYKAAENHLYEVITLDPKRESAVCNLMLVLEARGQYLAAIQVYNDFRAHSPPSPVIRKIHERIEAKIDLRPRPPLPAQRFKLIGRTQVLEEIERLLQEDETRMATLRGIGGVGKSSVALQVAHDLEPRFAGGVCFADITPLTRAEEVIPHLLGKFGLRSPPQVDPFDTLCNALNGIQALLILDNVEHLEDIEKIILTILDGCHAVKILATSRRALSLRWQKEIELRPLKVPAPDASFAQIAEAESVRLFERGAQSIESAFALTADNARAVAEICRIVAGIPLGVELAARTTRLYTPVEIATQLQLLDVRDPTPGAWPPRSSLRAVFEFSYGLLPSAPRRLLHRLVVFRGGFTREAARAICGGGDVEDVSAALQTLLEHSWVEQMEDEAAGDPTRRYWLLEPVAEFVRETCRARPEGLSASHARYYRDLAQETESLLHSRDDAEAHRRLRRDLDNFRAAFRWACDAGAHEVIAPLGSSLSMVMFEAGLWEECLAWIEKATRSAAALGDALILSNLATVQGDIALWRDDLPCARDRHEEALRFANEARSHWAMLRVHCNLAEVMRASGEREACARYADAIIRLAPKVADMASTGALGYIYLAAIAELDGRVEAAERLWEKSRSIIEESGSERMRALWERERGQVKEEKGDLESAARFYHASLRRRRELGLEQYMAQALGRLARVALKQGDPRRCARLLFAAGHLPQDTQADKVVNDVTQRLRAQTGEASFQQLLDETRTLSIKEVVAECEPM
jgi:predicted ATPase/DNA-binding SARP family transcriptional activator